MHYSGSVYRPPSEAYSLIVQVTLGCSHNKCAFCNMYKDKKFSIVDIEQVMADLQWARDRYDRIERIFLADGDALILPTEHLHPGAYPGVYPGVHLCQPSKHPAKNSGRSADAAGSRIEHGLFGFGDRQ